jgi:hypothetical protein
LPDGSLRYIAKDTSKGTMPFGQVAFHHKDCATAHCRMI